MVKWPTFMPISYGCCVPVTFESRRALKLQEVFNISQCRSTHYVSLSLSLVLR